MFLSGSESSANSAGDSVKAVECWSVHMWMPFFLRGSSSRASFRILKASNNNFSKRYRVVHTRSDLSVRRPCIAVLHPASIEVSPVCLESKKKDP